ncbi:C-GCAxxG-C-C family (seleno)protein [Oceanirhabdus sp. W0125-5]|uniref:C-GCAxxG-C-C family (seleno)protein n=1 Tax=Oceanirhabdus sp. W0125-5 TaxID=2999116 RepID=UPI0022F2DF81|nr:C-GCAxxG-C-C family (seleno)protein [Oceanirhabdus sp. W0125-5]WBW94933.1 C-GCAxxG-C-C family (seleno)protein [Oceanirhabdus sp. W0125-5]
MNKREEALMLFDKGFNCSQAVFSVFCEEFGLDKNIALKVSTGFGGGLRNGEICGAVSGAIMAVGLKEGHCIENDLDSKDRAYSHTRDFIDRFKERNNTIICRELLGHDISNEEELQIIKDRGLFNTICPKVIVDAVEILEDFLCLDNKEFGEKVPNVEYKERVAVYALIVDNSKNIAVINTSRGNFLPGGGLEINETLQECLHREIIEETGYKIEIDRFICKAVLYEYSPKLKRYIKGIGYFYKADLLEKACDAKEEDHNLSWLRIDDAKNNMLLEHQAWAIEQISNL